MTASLPLSGLAEIAARYEVVLFDQFGVLHDGHTAFSGAREAVAALKTAGVRTAVLSNSGRRAEDNAARLATLGFERALFDAVLTSGEICRARLAEDLAAGRLAAGTGVFVVPEGRRALPLDGLALTLAAKPEDAGVVLIAGREPAKATLEEDISRLMPLARRGVACLCANPDRIMYAGPDGQTAPGPGALAQAYANTGAPVEMIGKPHPAIFRAALAALSDPKPARVLMVGDSPEHDIAGAKAVGCATLLITSGVQGATPGEAIADFTLERLCWQKEQA
ncbi:MAG: TIGR01459 family HAD-type hydrolase [Pseudomonadota bacterium]